MAGVDSDDSTDSLNLIRGTVKIKIDPRPQDPQKVTNPFQYKGPAFANTVANVITSKSRTDQIEAAIEVIDRARRENIPRGLVLDPAAVTADKPRKVEDMVKVKAILGEGNSAGEVITAHDVGTGKEFAMKTILLIHFNKDEIRAWVHLADMGKSPQLYSFHMEDNRVVMKMEILEGKTLKQIIDSEGFGKLQEKPVERKCFSLLVLHGLLENFQLLKDGKFTHGDGHGGNTVVLPTLEFQLIDFGSAKGIRPGDGIDHVHKLKADVVNIIRQFCAAYTGVDFSTYSEAQKALEQRDFRKIETVMPEIPESDRHWLFSLMLLAFETVRYRDQEGYADTGRVTADVEAMLPSRKELEDMKKKIAVLLFPENYKSRHHDPEFVTESEFGDEGETILDDPQIADLTTLVDLRKDFGDFSLA